jgi:Fe-S-cluster-containing dehydrogenase component
MENSRRKFLHTSSILAASLYSGNKLVASEVEQEKPINYGVLVDTTICVGCRNCEWACKTAHNIPTDELETYHQNRDIFKEFRRPNPKAYTVVNEFENPDNELIPINVKYQCMHCNQPACVSACIVGAFTKNDNGAVTWDTDKCIGCRYCMVACPFQIPTFDFDKALVPDIHKCDFCYDRTTKGLLPACVEKCPVEALLFGPKDEILRVAKKRIQRYPDNYSKKIFGEKEVGGTSWIYLSKVDFSKLRFPKLKEKPAPGVSEAIQHGIFSYFIPPLALYAWLGGVMWVSKRKQKLEEELNKGEK